MRAQSSQVQPECDFECGLGQSAFQQADTHVKRALSEACCAVSLPWTQQRRVACRLSSLPFRITAHPFRLAKTTSLFLLCGTHTGSPSSLFKAVEGTLAGDFSACRARSGDCERVKGTATAALILSATNECFYLEAYFPWGMPQSLVCLSAAFQCSRAGPSRESGQPSTCTDRKWILV